MSIVLGANILVTLNASCPTSDELDAAQALSSIAVLDTISDLDTDDETFGFNNSKRETFAQENVFRDMSAKHIANVVRNCHLPIVMSSRKRLLANVSEDSGLDHKHDDNIQKRKKVMRPKCKFQLSFEEFDSSHYVVSGPYFVPRRLILDNCDGVRFGSTSKMLQATYNFGSKHRNVWHTKNRLLLPDFVFSVYNKYKKNHSPNHDNNCDIIENDKSPTYCQNQDNSDKHCVHYCARYCRLEVWQKTTVSPPNNSLLVCNVGKRSFFMVWNES
jgi:hypothetical protein